MEEEMWDIPDDLQDAIDGYLFGSMTTAAREAFERRMAHDERLRQEVLFTCMVKDTLEQRDRMKAKMEKWKREEEKKSLRRRRMAVAAVAALIVTGVFIASRLMKPSYDCTVDDNYVYYRGGTSTREMAKLINEGRYNEALSRIEKEERTLRRQHTDTLFYGLPQEEARKRGRYQQETEARDLDELTWLKAHALMGLGRKTEALQLLDSLRHGDGHRREQAEQLYEEWK